MKLLIKFLTLSSCLLPISLVSGPFVPDLIIKFPLVFVALPKVVPPSLKNNEFTRMVEMLFAIMEIVEPPKGSSKVEQLLDHLEDYCTDRTASGATKEDMMLGNDWTHEGVHHFIFREFFHKYLLKNKWDEKYDETQMLLTDKCGCKIKREMIGKQNKTIMTIE